MKPDFDLSHLKGRKLFVGTPMYDGKCFSDYAFSIVRLTALCTQIGIELRFFFRSHEALIANARNETVEQFLLSGCDSLLFIDADIGFDARDALQLFAMQMASEAYDVLAAPYPLKQIDWARVLQAAKAGLADRDPALLAHVSSGMRVDLADGSDLNLNAPAEVTQAGTGFMLIRLAVFDRLRKGLPELAYRRDGSDPAAPPFAFFETAIDRAGSGLMISEDYTFCRRVRAAGMKVWLVPWVELTHSGHHRFDSRLADLGALGPI